MTLITLQTPTPSQSIKHLLETTLFLKQSNWSQSQINSTINEHGILKFRRSCVSNSTPAEQPQLLLFTLRQCDKETFSTENEGEASTHLLRHKASYCVPQVAHYSTKRRGKWRTLRRRPLEKSRKFTSIASNCSTVLWESSCLHTPSNRK